MLMTFFAYSSWPFMISELGLSGMIPSKQLMIMREMGIMSNPNMALKSD